MSDHMGAPRAARAGDAADREAVEQAGVNGLIEALFRCADENPRPAALLRHAAHEIGFLDSALRAQADRVAALDARVRELEQEREELKALVRQWGDEAQRLTEQNASWAALVKRTQGDMLDAIKQREAARAAAERSEGDTRRLDWLEQQTVNVRQPARYGSWDLFWSKPEDDDGEVRPSDIRARIDAAISTPRASAAPATPVGGANG